MKKATAKTATSKNAPAKKAAVKKVEVKKAASKKIVVKKAVAKKQPVKAAPVRVRNRKKVTGVSDKNQSDAGVHANANFCKIEISEADSARLKAVSDKFGENSNEFQMELLRTLGTAGIQKEETSKVSCDANNKSEDCCNREFSALDVLTDMVQQCVDSDDAAIEWIDALAETRNDLIAQLEKRQVEEQNCLNSRISSLKIRQKSN